MWISLADRAGCVETGGAVDPSLPLAGIPFAVKDNVDVEGMATTAGCPSFAYQAARSATVVRRLIEAGAIIIGKTNLDQFATGLVGMRSPYGACSSVFDKRYISGGSSSGSAVAVAQGLCAFALGTDTAGSGRVPCSVQRPRRREADAWSPSARRGSSPRADRSTVSQSSRTRRPTPVRCGALPRVSTPLMRDSRTALPVPTRRRGSTEHSGSACLRRRGSGVLRRPARRL